MAGTEVIAKVRLQNTDESGDVEYETYTLAKTFRVYSLLGSLEDKLADDGYDGAEWGVDELELMYRRDDYVDVTLDNLNPHSVPVDSLASLSSMVSNAMIERAQQEYHPDATLGNDPTFHLPDYDDLPDEL